MPSFYEMEIKKTGKYKTEYNLFCPSNNDLRSLVVIVVVVLIAILVINFLSVIFWEVCSLNSLQDHQLEMKGLNSSVVPYFCLMLRYNRKKSDACKNYKTSTY